MDMDEVIEMLKLKNATACNKLIKEEGLPFFKVGKKIMFSRHDVYIWCEKQMNKNYSKEIYGN